MYSSNIVNDPAVSGWVIKTEYLINSQQAVRNRIHRELTDNDFIKGFITATAFSIPIWAFIIWGIKLFFF